MFIGWVPSGNGRCGCLLYSFVLHIPPCSERRHCWRHSAAFKVDRLAQHTGWNTATESHGHDVSFKSSCHGHHLQWTVGLAPRVGAAWCRCWTPTFVLMDRMEIKMNLDMMNL